MNRTNALSAAAALVLLLFPPAACRPERPLLGPVPPEIRTIEGFASLRYARGGAAAKARLAFLFVPPGRARIEGRGPLNQRIFEVIVEEPEAVLIVPSKKAFWRGPRVEVLESGLGFPLNLPEIIGLLIGRWDASSAGWDLELDAAGRVAGGRRSGFAFRVEEFFPGSPVARKLRFQGKESEGALTVLSLEFNTTDPDARIGSSLPPGYARVSRAEMEKLLRDAN